MEISCLNFGSLNFTFETSQEDDLATNSLFSPAAEVGNSASLDKVFFFTDYFSLGYVQ